MPTPSLPVAYSGPIAELSTTGLLWLINRVVFHPRGFALGLVLNADGAVTEFQLLGDGSEPWSYPAEGEQAKLRAVQELLSPTPAPPTSVSELLTAPQVAQRLGISRQAVIKRAPTLGGMKVGPRLWVFNPAVIDALAPPAD